MIICFEETCNALQQLSIMTTRDAHMAECQMHMVHV